MNSIFKLRKTKGRVVKDSLSGHLRTNKITKKANRTYNKEYQFVFVNKSQNKQSEPMLTYA